MHLDPTMPVIEVIAITLLLSPFWIMLMKKLLRLGKETCFSLTQG